MTSLYLYPDKEKFSTDQKKSQKILDAKIADTLSKLKSSEMLFTDLFD